MVNWMVEKCMQTGATLIINGDEEGLQEIQYSLDIFTPLHILDLCSGLHGWTNPFEGRGHIIRSVELNTKFEASLHADISTLSADDLRDLFPDRRIDVILASPPCTTFSVASLGTHWGLWPDGSRYRPKTEKCKTMVKLVKHIVHLIEEINPRYFWVENPRGVLRKLDIIPAEWDHAVVWYCQYSSSSHPEPRAKPTDLWGRWPERWIPRPPCKNGATARGECHHEPAPRGAKTGTQGLKGNAERSLIPYELAKSVMESLE